MKFSAARHMFAAATAVAIAMAAGARTVVKLSEKDGAWRLERNGREFFIQGAGGGASKAALAAVGGNSFRTWAATHIDEELDNAKKHALCVMCGFWLGHAEHGFDYTDAQSLAQTEKEVLKTVNRVKNHDALLCWALGNEMEMNNPHRKEMWAFIDRLAGKIKKIDPDHPVCTVVAEIPDQTLKEFGACANLDFLGINSYGGASSLLERWTKAGMKKPYAVTEYGARGSWEGPKDSEGMPIEPTSTEKKEMFLSALKDIERGRAAGMCLGGFAFTWGWKVESTPTWHGMLLPDMTRTGPVEAVQEAWGRKKVANRCPEISSIKTSMSYLPETKGALTAWADAKDPDGDKLTWRWELFSDTGDYDTIGTGLAVPPGFPEAIVSGQGTSSVVVQLPGGGMYRLYAYVFDGKGNAAYANVPVNAPGDMPTRPLPAKEMPVAVYKDDCPAIWFASGYMGNTRALKLDEMCGEAPHSGRHCLKVEYSDHIGWGGVYWQDPANDWGEKAGGRNLSKATTLRFWARGAEGGERVTFFMGGLSGKKFSDTAKAELKDAILKKEWTRYRIPLDGKDLSRIKSGFGFVVASDGTPMTFYLDDIEYISEE